MNIITFKFARPIPITIIVEDPEWFRLHFITFHDNLSQKKECTESPKNGKPKDEP